MSTDSGSAPAGWYPDSTAAVDRPSLRWWDGEHWTEHTAPGAPMPSGALRGVTPDGVPLADWWQRVGAYLIDSLVLIVPILVLGSPFLLAMAHDYSAAFDRAATTSADGTSTSFHFSLAGGAYGPAAGFTAVALVVTLAYQAIMLKTRSATVGKLAVGLRVRLRETPGPLGWATIGRRLLGQFGINLLRLIPFVGSLAALYVLLDLLWPLWDDKKQALHDKIAGTNVVQHRP